MPSGTVTERNYIIETGIAKRCVWCAIHSIMSINPLTLCMAQCLQASFLSFSINIYLHALSVFFIILQRTQYYTWCTYLILPVFSIFGQNSVKILTNPYTWRHCWLAKLVCKHGIAVLEPKWIVIIILLDMQLTDCFTPCACARGNNYYGNWSM